MSKAYRTPEGDPFPVSLLFPLYPVLPFPASVNYKTEGGGVGVGEAKGLDKQRLALD